MNDCETAEPHQDLATFVPCAFMFAIEQLVYEAASQLVYHFYAILSLTDE